MEIIIILLIAVEVCLALIREGHEVASLIRSYFADEKEVEALSEAAESEHALFGQVADAAGVSEMVRDDIRSDLGSGRRLV